MLTLNQTWQLLYSINEKANLSVWTNNQIDSIHDAVNLQSTVFRNCYFQLDNEQQKSICFWLEKDDEFQDFFKCLFGIEEYNKLLF